MHAHASSRRALLPLLLLLLLLLLLQPCTPLPCAHGETWNPLLQFCACLPGYGGADCSVPTYPQCVGSTEGLPPGVPPQAGCAGAGTSCGCMRECTATPVARWHPRDCKAGGGRCPCFEREAGGVGNPSARPTSPSEPGVSYYTHFVERMRAPSTHTEWADWVAKADWVGPPPRPAADGGPLLLPPSACPRGCSGEGVCVAPGVCRCARHAQGEGCERPVPSACALSCSARGTCVRGVCVCDAPFFGLGCTESGTDAAVAAAAAATAAGGWPQPGALPPPPWQLRVYVWDLPTALGVQAVADASRPEAFPGPKSPSDYHAQWLLLLRLLGDDVVRVRTPGEASLHYVPDYNWYWAMHVGLPGGDAREHMARLVAFLGATQPYAAYWARRGGADFAFFLGGDLGGCTLPQSLARVIILSEYGLTNFTKREATQSGPCFVSSRGVAVPTTLNFDAAAEANKTWHGDAASAPARPTRFFFSGSYGRDEGTGYSLGARLAVRSAVVLANRTDYVFIGPNGGYGPHNMQRDAMLSAMRSSVFCLAPSGNGYGNRITYAMVAGCIPVVVQPSVRQPLDDVLPYWRFSLRLRLEDAPNLVQILDAVTPGEVEALQSHVKLYHSYFLWRGWSDLPGASGWTGEGLAYEGVLESLRRKLYHIQADMEGEGAAPLPAGG